MLFWVSAFFFRRSGVFKILLRTGDLKQGMIDFLCCQISWQVCHFSTHTSASVEVWKDYVHRYICMKTRTTNSLKAETVKTSFLVRLSQERIRHVPAGNQTNIINYLHGTVSKRYKDRLKYENMSLSLIVEVIEWMRKNSCNLWLKYLETYLFKCSNNFRFSNHSGRKSEKESILFV